MELILAVVFLIGAIAGVLGAIGWLRAHYQANREFFYRICAVCGGYFAYLAVGVLGFWGVLYVAFDSRPPEIAQADDHSSIFALLFLLFFVLWLVEGAVWLNRTLSPEPPPWLGKRFNWLDAVILIAALSAAAGCVAIALAR